MKFFIGFVITAALIVRVKSFEEVEEETFKCSAFHNDTKFDLLGLQLAVEVCDPELIVNHCDCPQNYLRFTKNLLNTLKLVHPDCPKENQCISLKYLKQLFTCYADNGRNNCHS